MTPVMQAFIDDKAGDCLQACIASVLELKLADVPKFSELGFMSEVRRWAERTERTAIWFEVPEFTSLDKIYFGNVPPFFIAWGESPRQTVDGKPKQHAVVVKGKGYGVELAHDPHPDGTGLRSTFGVLFIVEHAQRVKEEHGKDEPSST